MRSRLLALLLATACMALPAAAQTQSEIRIGLGDDPGSLDPATNASFVGRIVLQSACDKLVDIDVDGNIVPMLATSWDWAADGKSVTMKLREGVVYHDDTPFDAESAKGNLERYLTMQGSRRRPEIEAIEKVEAIGKDTIKISLKEPSVALLALFTDRAGMMVSLAAFEKAGVQAFANRPICAGPYRVADFKPQQSVTLERFPKHWRASAYSFDRVTFEPFPDSNVRLLNLRSGRLDLIEQVAPTSLASVEADPNLRITVGQQPAFTMIQFNLTAPRASEAFAKHPEVRQAFSLAIDRTALNQVVFSGRYVPGHQPFPPGNFWFDETSPAPQPRDVARARALLRQVGVPNPTLELLISTNSEHMEVAQVVQQMVAEAGFRMEIRTMEFIAMRNAALQGNFQAYMVPSAGRVDPDLNISLFIACGVANNVGKYCSQELDGLLAQGRAVADRNARKPIYQKAVQTIQRDAPIIFLFNQRSAFGHKAVVQGFKGFPDGIVRLEGVTKVAGR
jgi:peptide/nickel transport system substrate-binding protein